MGFAKKDTVQLLRTSTFGDEYDLNYLYEILENQVLPMYYENYPAWRQIIKNGMDDVRYQFNSNRMANEYYELLYK